jgi:hypothetical protein
MLRQILESIVILFFLLFIHPLGSLLHVGKEDIDQTLEDLHFILDISKDQAHPLYLHHLSFRDFLLSKDRCNDSNFWVDKKQAHQILAKSCVQLMSISFKQDVCGLGLLEFF